MLLESIMTAVREEHSSRRILKGLLRDCRVEIISIKWDYEITKSGPNWAVMRDRSQSVRGISALRKWEKRRGWERSAGIPPRFLSEREKRLVRARAPIVTVHVCVYVSAKDRFLVTSFLHRVYKTQPGLALTNSLTEQRFSFRTHEISDRKDSQRNSAYIFNIT